MPNPQILLVATVLIPGCAFLVMAVAWLLGIHLREKATTRLAEAAYGSATLCLAGVAFSMLLDGRELGPGSGNGNFFSVGDFRIPLVVVCRPPLTAVAGAHGCPGRSGCPIFQAISASRSAFQPLFPSASLVRFWLTAALWLRVRSIC